METAVAKAVLEAAGLPTDKFDELDKLTADQAKDFKADPYLEPILTAQQTKMLNDPKFYETHITEDKLPAEFKTKIEAGQYGRFMNELRDVATKTLGLKEGEDFTKEDLPKLKIFAEKIAKGYAGKNAPSGTVKEIQDKLVEALKNNETLTAEQEEKITAAVSKEKTTLAGQMEKLISIQEVAAIKDLSVKPHLVAGPLLTALKDKYAVILNPETMKFDLRQKVNPELKVLNGSTEVTFAQALADMAKEEGLIKQTEQEKEKEKEGIFKVGVDGEGAAVIPDYIKKSMDLGDKK